MGRRAIGVGLALALSLLVPASVSALIVERTKSEPLQSFLGDECGTATVEMNVPRGARDVTALRPTVGEQLNEGSRGDHAATVIDFSIIGRRAVWTAQGAGRYCPPPPCNYICDNSWWTVDFPSQIAYSKNIRLHAYQADSALRRTLSAKFGNAWRHSYGQVAFCRGVEPRWKCRIQFIIGDGEYVGGARIKARAHRGEAQFVVRYRVRRFDGYCLAVGDNPRSECIRKYRGTDRV